MNKLSREKFGSTFKKIRLMKGYTTIYVCQGIVSRQYIRKFENGDIDISMSNLNKLLYRMKVTWNEFIIRNMNINIDSLDIYISEIEKEIRNFRYHISARMIDNIYEGTNIFENVDSKLIEIYYLKSKSIFNRIKLGNSLELAYFPKNKAFEIISDTMKIDKWTKFERNLLIYFFELYEYDVALILVNKELRKLKNLKNKNQEYSSWVLKLCYNFILYQIKIEKFSDARYIINSIHTLSNIINDKENMYIYNLLKFEDGLVYIYQGEYNKGIYISDLSLKIFNLLEGYKATTFNMRAERRVAILYYKNNYT